MNTEIIDEILTVTNEQAIEAARKLAKSEGILCGISSGAAVWAALQVGNGLRIQINLSLLSFLTLVNGI